MTALVILSASVPLKAANGSYYFPPGGLPIDVDYHGTQNQVVQAVQAGVRHVVMVSSMGTTTPNSFLDLLGDGHALFYKLQARRDRNWSLNEGQTPNVRGVHVHASTGYDRVEGNRRASRNGRVGDLPSPQRHDSQLFSYRCMHCR